MSDDDDQRSVTRDRVILFALEVQERIDAIFARNPDCVRVIPWIGRDGELTFVEIEAVDAGL
jgi:hypothetical protein